MLLHGVVRVAQDNLTFALPNEIPFSPVLPQEMFHCGDDYTLKRGKGSRRMKLTTQSGGS